MSFNAGRVRLNRDYVGRETQTPCADLRSQDAVCADLYQRAIDTMSTDPRTEVDLMVTAHAMRELINRFPRVTGSVELRPGRSTRDDVRRFVEAWEAHVGLVMDTDEEVSVIVVPRPVVDAAEELSANFRAGSASNWRLRSALVIGRTDVENDPAVDEVGKWAKSFEKLRHPQGDTTDWLETEADSVRTAIEVIENALEARLGSFFGVVDQLKEILDRANTERVNPDGSVTRPAPDERDLRDVVSRLGDVQHRRVFFGSLRNPLWLDPLADRGLFSHTPPHEVDAEGRWLWIPWPEGEYLAAIAPARPERVATILKQAVRRGAAHDARRQLLKAALAMPPDDAATLVSTLVLFVEPAIDLQSGFDILKLIEKLAARGNLRDARTLAWALLRPRAGAERRSGVEVESAIDRDWYAEAMERVLPALRTEPTLLTWLVNRLADAERIARTDPSAGGYDLSYIWRPAIGVQTPRHDRYDIRHVLIDAVRDVALERLADDHPVDQVIGTIERTSVPLLRRIALYVLAQRASASVPADEVTLQLGLERLVNTDLIDNYAVRAEYLALARSVLPHLTDADFERWSTALACYPRQDSAVVDRIGSRLVDGETLEDALADQRARLRHELLTAIGASALRNDALTELTQFDDKHGEIETSDEPHVTHWSDDNNSSPFDAAQLGAMTPTKVIEILRTWEPESDDPSGPNRAGLGREFRTAVKQHTLEYSRFADAALTLPHLYVSHYLDGLHEGAQEHLSTLNWERLLLALPSLPSSSDKQRPDDGPDSHSWGHTIRKALALVGLGAHDRRNAPPLELLPAAATFVVRYLTDPDPAPDPEPDGEEGKGPTHGSGPLQQSLYAVRSEAVRVLVSLALYEHQETAESARPGPVTILTAERLSRLMTPNRDGSGAVAAALGEAYGKILTFAPDWIDKHRAQLLSADSFGEVVVTTALAEYRTSRRLLESLAPNIADLISRAGRGDRIAEGWKADRTPLQRIGDHLMLLYLWGDYELDAPLVDQFFRDAPPEVREASWVTSAGCSLTTPSSQRTSFSVLSGSGRPAPAK